MEGYKQKKYPVATKRYVQWLELESDEEVDKFQKCGKGATSDEKWHMMERIFYLYD